MALKDWVRVGEDKHSIGYENKKTKSTCVIDRYFKPIYTVSGIIEPSKPNKSVTLWSKEFQNEPDALAYAKKYMKSNGKKLKDVV